MPPTRANRSSRATRFAVLPFNLKAGLTHNIDLQFVLETWAWNKETAGGSTQRQRGLGAISRAHEGQHVGK